MVLSLLCSKRLLISGEEYALIVPTALTNVCVYQLQLEVHITSAGK
jgi:hypothetical protein